MLWWKNVEKIDQKKYLLKYNLYFQNENSFSENPATIEDELEL